MFEDCLRIVTDIGPNVEHDLAKRGSGGDMAEGIQLTGYSEIGCSVIHADETGAVELLPESLETSVPNPWGHGRPDHDRTAAPMASIIFC